jgi:S-adenosylmethionine decarboxylase
MNHKVEITDSNINSKDSSSDAKISKYGFGPHLMVDGYGCEKSKITDIKIIYQLLDELPGIIGMTKMMPPYVFPYKGLRPEDWGLSGFVLIAESHISIHTFPDKNYLSFDIFSCKPFQHEKAIKYLIDKFGIKTQEINVLDRGLQFPHYASIESLNKGIGLAKQERKTHVNKIPQIV